MNGGFSCDGDGAAARCMRPVVQKIGTHRLESDQFARLLCYQFRIRLQEIYESAIGANPFGRDWLTSRCNSIVAAASQLKR